MKQYDCFILNVNFFRKEGCPESYSQKLLYTYCTGCPRKSEKSNHLVWYKNKVVFLFLAHQHRPKIMTVPINCHNWYHLGVSRVLKRPSVTLLIKSIC